MKEYLEKALTYEGYIKLIDDLLLDGKTTGPNQSEATFGYGKLNRRRMHRLEKTTELNDTLKTAARQFDRRMIWLVITEGWCGDAAQNVPVIEKIAAESINIETRYILRDENHELIDRYLTESGRSIPKLLALDAETLEVVGTWGSRPAPAQQLYRELKKRGLEKPLIMENLQRWYNADSSRTIQAEFGTLLARWGEKAEMASAV
ncbi:MAG: thioredoxin family protein [Saprospiraceae bacterium]|nr:thioredoxin family protein [Pyrinomonadaceae bacterium]